ncbi:MAG TPA: hypothetical protein VIY47_12025, partial [Ignavibacteriaceae bacterium]
WIPGMSSLEKGHLIQWLKENPGALSKYADSLALPFLKYSRYVLPIDSWKEYAVMLSPLKELNYWVGTSGKLSGSEEINFGKEWPKRFFRSLQQVSDPDEVTARLERVLKHLPSMSKKFGWVDDPEWNQNIFLLTLKNVSIRSSSMDFKNDLSLYEKFKEFPFCKDFLVASSLFLGDKECEILEKRIREDFVTVKKRSSEKNWACRLEELTGSSGVANLVHGVQSMGLSDSDQKYQLLVDGREKLLSGITRDRTSNALDLDQDLMNFNENS